MRDSVLSINNLSGEPIDVIDTTDNEQLNPNCD